jgi:uncharacterized protein
MENSMIVEGHNLYTTNKICLHSGHYVDVFDIKSTDINLDDVAHGCSHCPRWAGQTKIFLSSAQHSIEVFKRVRLSVIGSHKIEFPGMQNYTPWQIVDLLLQALFHDASDGYLFDAPAPYKKRLPQFVALENDVMNAVAERFGFTWPISEIVKTEDKNQLEWEWKHYMHGKKQPMTSKQAKKEFISCFEWIGKYKNTFC